MTVVAVFLAVAPTLSPQLQGMAVLFAVFSGFCGIIFLFFASMSLFAWITKKPGSGREFRKQQCVNLLACGIVAFIPAFCCILMAQLIR